MSIGPIDPFQNIKSVPGLFIPDGGVTKVNMAGEVLWSNPLNSTITQAVVNAEGMILAAPSQLHPFTAEGREWFILSPEGDQVGGGAIPEKASEFGPRNVIYAVTWSDDGACIAWQDNNEEDPDNRAKISTPLGTASVGRFGYSQIGATGSTVYLGGVRAEAGGPIVVAASDGVSVSHIPYPVESDGPYGCVGSPHGVYVGGGDSDAGGHLSNLSWVITGLGIEAQYVAASETAVYTVVLNSSRSLIKVSPDGDILWSKTLDESNEIGALSAAGGVVYVESDGLIKRFKEDGTELDSIPASAGWITAIPQITGSN